MNKIGTTNFPDIEAFVKAVRTGWNQIIFRMGSGAGNIGEHTVSASLGPFSLGKSTESKDRSKPVLMPLFLFLIHKSNAKALESENDR